ncbi:MAG: hypothetical protein CSB06_03755 [Bacteroidia bacterium]|nr:MAG: hypothetical protein CSB06_03755 [Bacteroidia bacterium]
MSKDTHPICSKDDFPDKLIGIRYNGAGYHLAWQMNKMLKISLSELPSICYTNKHGKSDVFYVFGEENGRELRYLFKNKSKSHFLFPHLKNFDFFYLQVFDYKVDTIQTVRAVFELPECLFCSNIKLNQRQSHFLYQILFQNPQEDYAGKNPQNII